MAPKTKRVILIGGAGLLAFAVALTLFLNRQANVWSVLYPGMEATEVTEVYNMVKELGVETQLNSQGQIMVKADKENYVIGQLALKNYPRSTLPYDIFNGSGGLTTTDFEKKQQLVQQLQNRLQDTINTYDGVVPRTIVTINMAQETGRVWETTAPKSSGSVSVFMQPGYELSPTQVSAIKWLVASGVPKMDKSDVVVIDGNTKVNLRSLDDVDDSLDVDLKRLNFERMVEEKMEQKALNLLTLAYPPDQVRASATVTLDYKKMVTESKQYSPSDMSTKNSGVLQHEDNAYTRRDENVAQGIPGEENNTDTTVPTYDNLTGTGNESITDSSSSADYAVSYILNQIEKDKAELQSASIAVTILVADPNSVDPTTTQSLIESVAKATNLTTDYVSVQYLAITSPSPTPTPDVTQTLSEWIQENPLLFLIVVGSAFLLLLLLIILLIALRRRAAKKKQIVEQEEQIEAELEEQEEENDEFDLQQELEERKRQLRENAQTVTADEAITNEVREFARENPEITANLLRAWMKEDID